MSTRIQGEPRVNSTLLADDIMTMVRELSQDLEQESTQTARDGAKEELRLGLAQADEMHQQASTMRTGALVAGAMTAGSGLTMTGFAVGGAFSSSPSAIKTADRGYDLAKSSIELPRHVEVAYQGAAKHNEAEGTKDGALAKAVGHDIDAANERRRTLRETESSALESYKEALRAQHAAVMATLVRG